jgi:protein-disulfide isomerase
VVHRIEQQLDAGVTLLHVDVMTAEGLALASRYGVRATPTLVVLDGAGAQVYASMGIPNVSAVMDAVATLR